jgi:hypothetical protein
LKANIIHRCEQSTLLSSTAGPPSRSTFAFSEIQLALAPTMALSKYLEVASYTCSIKPLPKDCLDLSIHVPGSPRTSSTTSTTGKRPRCHGALVGGQVIQVRGFSHYRHACGWSRHIFQSYLRLFPNPYHPGSIHIKSRCCCLHGGKLTLGRLRHN